MNNLDDVAALVNSNQPDDEHSEVLEFIQEQIDFHKNSAERFKHQKYRLAKHTETVSNFRHVRNYLNELKKEAEKSRNRQ